MNGQISRRTNRFDQACVRYTNSKNAVGIPDSTPQDDEQRTHLPIDPALGRKLGALMVAQAMCA